MKPPIPYFGSKGRLASRIVGMLPQHGHYVEPYAGSLAVLLAKPRSRMETVNDLDGDLMFLLPDCCTWCGHAPHTTRCTVTGCPCAYRKDPR